MNELPNIFLKDHQLRYPNFSGRQTDLNPQGNRTFEVVLTPEEAQQLSAMGIHVKDKIYNDEQEFRIKVGVNFSFDPPRAAFCVVDQQGNQKLTNLTEETIGAIDTAEIISSDIVIRPYQRRSKVNPGISLALKGIVVKIQPDPLAELYGY